MRSLILHDHEVVKALTGSVLVVRAIPGVKPEWELMLAQDWGRKDDVGEVKFMSRVHPWAAVSRTKWLSCPYPPGSQAWVKEAWRPYWWSSDFRRAIHEIGIEYRADGRSGTLTFRSEPQPRLPGDNRRDRGSDGRTNWRSATWMPRKASRLTLTLADVRVMQVQTMCEDGLLPMTPDEWNQHNHQTYERTWDANPWAWVMKWENGDG